MASRICDKINDSIKRGRKGTRGGGGGLTSLDWKQTASNVARQRWAFVVKLVRPIISL